MKQIGEIMNELGFDKDASPSVAKAFIKHLIRENKKIEKESGVHSVFRDNTYKLETKLETNIDLNAENKNKPNEHRKNTIPLGKRKVGYQLDLFADLTDQSQTLHKHLNRKKVG